jgi:hypothetical protein
VLPEAHLAFQVREDALDRQARAGEGALAAAVGGRSPLRRCQQVVRQLVCEAETAVDEGLAAGPIELLVCFDAEEVDGSVVAADLAAELPEKSSTLSHRLVPVPGAEYYALKNAGAREVEGELLVFVDSDVVPDPGWLGDLLRPFDDETVGVVAGNSYLEPTEKLPLGLTGMRVLTTLPPMRLSATIRPFFILHVPPRTTASKL